MTIEQLRKWAVDLPMEDWIDLVMFYSRLCKVCAELDKEDEV